MMFDGAAWQYVGSRGITGNSSADVSLAIAPDDMPYIAFRDTGNANKISVMKFDGVNWIGVGTPGFSAYAVDPPTWPSTPSGIPYVSFNTINGFDADLCVMKFDGANWVEVGSSIFSTDDQPYEPTLALSSTGVPYVAVRDQNDTTIPSTYKISVLTFDGANWVFVGDRRFSDNYCESPHIALNSYDTPYVIFSDDALTYNGEATVMRYNGASWMLAGSARFSSGEAAYPRIVFDMSDTPYALFADSGYAYKTVVQRLNGSTWEIVGSPGFSGGRAYGCASTIYGNTIYAAYTDASQSYNATVMEYVASGPLYAPIPVITEQPADAVCVEGRIRRPDHCCHGAFRNPLVSVVCIRGRKHLRRHVVDR